MILELVEESAMRRRVQKTDSFPGAFTASSGPLSRPLPRSYRGDPVVCANAPITGQEKRVNFLFFFILQ